MDVYEARKLKTLKLAPRCIFSMLASSMLGFIERRSVAYYCSAAYRTTFAIGDKVMQIENKYDRAI
jgi:hypothetical protein